MRDVSLRKRRRTDDLRVWKGVKIPGSDLQAAFDAQSSGNVHYGQWMLATKAPQYNMTFAHALWQHSAYCTTNMPCDTALCMFHSHRWAARSAPGRPPSTAISLATR